MAGYVGRPSTVAGDNYVNATALNSQIIEQRQATLIRHAEQQHHLHLGVNFGSNSLFSSFDSKEIMKNSGENFLKSVDPNENPNFAVSFNPKKFKSYSNIINEASSDTNKPLDGARPGVGPTLSTQNIDNALADNLRNEFAGEVNHRKRGFGWSSEKHKETTIGTYLSDKYINHASEAIILDRVIQGERIDTDPIDYNQPEVQSED